LKEVTGDDYAGDIGGLASFRRAGVRYRTSDQSRSELYLSLLPILTSGRARLLDNDRMVAQFTALERRTNPSGRDSVDHPSKKGSHDDVANAVAGALVLAAGKKGASLALAQPVLLQIAAMPRRDRFSDTSVYGGERRPGPLAMMVGRNRFARAR
jgi:hypothetical protein